MLGGCTPFYDAFGNPNGKLEVIVDWPEPERHLPSYAKSVSATVIPICCGHVETQVVNRPQAGGRTVTVF